MSAGMLTFGVRIFMWVAGLEAAWRSPCLHIQRIANGVMKSPGCISSIIMHEVLPWKIME